MKTLTRLAMLLTIALPSLVAQDGAPVVVDSQELWRVKTVRAGFSAAQRAEDEQSNLIHVAEDLRRRPDGLREIHTDSDSILIVGRIYLFSVTDDDARLEGKSRADLFAQRRRIAVDAIRGYREARSSASRIHSALFALAALLGILSVLALLRFAYRRVSMWGQGELARLSSSVSLYKAFEQWITLLVRLALQLAFLALSFLVAFAGGSFVLGLFPETAGLSGAALDGTAGVVRSVASAILSYLPNLLILILVSVLTFVLIRVAKILARATESGVIAIPSFHSEWARPTFDLVRILLIMFALVVAFPYLPGGDSPALRGASIFIGVLVSLGSGSAMGNVIAGIILTYMRPFRVGDRVQIIDTMGDVTERSLLVTRIRSIKNVEVIVPNSAVLGSHIANYSANAREQGLILHTTITIGYDAPWRKVHELLIRAALRTPFILPEPKPFVLQTSLNDSHVSYEINAFTNEANKMIDIYSELHQNIQEEFNAGGMEIMSPAFLSLRDGNSVTIPADHRPADYVAPRFRIQTQSAGTGPEAASGGAASSSSPGSQTDSPL